MNLEGRLRKLELLMDKACIGKTLRTICFLCKGAMPTDSQTEAALSNYKATRPNWDTEDLIEIRVNAG